MKTNLNPTRRHFLRTTAGIAATGPLLLSAVAKGTAQANDRIALGVIGVGMMGRGHLGRFLGYDDVQVVAISEVERTRRENAVQQVELKYAERKKSGQFKGCQSYIDFRDLLERTDIDAVVIATPDHSHAIGCLLAARAKKDIYCEKPLTHNIVEGRMIADAVKQQGVIFQTGSQQRSEFGGRFRRAVQLVRNGAIGQIKTVRVGVGAPPVPCDLPTEPTPTDVAWDLWLGPAAERGYNEVLCPQGMHRHFPAFRKYREFAGGGLADMGAHHFDIAQWALAMDDSGPVRIEPAADGKNSGLRMVYENGIEMFHGGPGGCTFEGSAGTIYVNRPVLQSTPENVVSSDIGRDDPSIYRSTDHRRNWIECIRSRQQTICPAEVGHRSATICHLANLGYRLQRRLTWDPKKEVFVNDDEANSLRFRQPRDNWSYDLT